MHTENEIIFDQHEDFDGIFRSRKSSEKSNDISIFYKASNSEQILGDSFQNVQFSVEIDDINFKDNIIFARSETPAMR